MGAQTSVQMLPFLVTIEDEPDTPSGGDMGIFSRRGGEPLIREIPLAALRESLRRAIDGLRDLFNEFAAGDGGMPLKQAEISFEVTSTGGIALVGTAQISGKGAITLTFGPQ